MTPSLHIVLMPIPSHWWRRFPSAICTSLPPQREIMLVAANCSESHVANCRCSGLIYSRNHMASSTTYSLVAQSIAANLPNAASPVAHRIRTFGSGKLNRFGDGIKSNNDPSNNLPQTAAPSAQPLKNFIKFHTSIQTWSFSLRIRVFVSSEHPSNALNGDAVNFQKRSAPHPMVY